MGTTQDLWQRALIDYLWNTTGDIVTLERDEYPVSDSLGNHLPGGDWRGNWCRYAMFHDIPRYFPSHLCFLITFRLSTIVIALCGEFPIWHPSHTGVDRVLKYWPWKHGCQHCLSCPAESI